MFPSGQGYFIKQPFLSSVCPLACVSVCLSVCLYICLSLCLSVCLSVGIYVFQSIYLPIFLSTYLFVCLPACLPACMSVCLFFGPTACFALFTRGTTQLLPLLPRLDPTDGIHPARQDRLYSRVRYPLEGKVRHLDIFARSEQHHGAFKHCLALRNRIDPLSTALQFCRKPSPNLTLIPSVPTTGMRS